MEREPQSADRRVARAVRSLAINREKAAVIYQRMERAESTVRGYLLANSLASTNMGGYQVELAGEDIHLTPVPAEGWRQLPLPEPEGGIQTDTVIRPRPEDIFTRKQAELMERAQAGKLPCPSCTKRLAAYLDLEVDVVLYCPDRSLCGFIEIEHPPELLR